MTKAYEDFFKKANQASQGPLPPKPRKLGMESPFLGAAKGASSKMQASSKGAASFVSNKPRSSSQQDYLHKMNVKLNSDLAKKLQGKQNFLGERNLNFKNDLTDILLQKKSKRKSPFSWKMIFITLLGFILALLGFTHIDQIESFSKKIEISLMGSASASSAAADSTTPPSEANDKKTKADDKSATTGGLGQDKETGAGGSGTATSGTSGGSSAGAGAGSGQETLGEAKDSEKGKSSLSEGKTADSSQEMDHLLKLNSRKHELDSREEELNRLESELEKKKEDLDKKISDLEKTRKHISTILEEKVQADDKKIETLVQFYSNMRPPQAAKVFETLDEDLAVEILGRMKKKNAAEILNLVKPEKAQVFSEKFAGYKRK